jgi:malate synthase
VLADRPNQLERSRDDVEVSARDLLDVRVTDGSITEAGLRANVSVAILYLESWLRGVGAAALFNLMEDTATAEISRSQIWQWIALGARLDDGTTVTRSLVERIVGEERQRIRDAIGAERFDGGRFDDAIEIFRAVALGQEFVDFLTLAAYAYLG